MKTILTATFAVALLAGVSGAAASDLIYRPINPSLGGDPLNGNWLLSQATAQTEGGGAPGFTIDFPDFGNIPQPPATPEPLPPVVPAPGGG